ncbi:hypothetical protein [Acanthopleuribacter pedis]|uniref:Uncharacterized protein n=1 Tax=Acanthopleuribacter pedis TaxID=442870 RepID=A0A8J7QDL0_9BACT|nr:hypothetical protein [Acanthopleuribacter pedis]MBO1322194.1 hypothetical protein [Acanthopleuribacter pedis]
MESEISSKIVQTVRDYKGSAPVETVELRTGIGEGSLREIVGRSKILSIDPDKKIVIFKQRKNTQK